MIAEIATYGYLLAAIAYLAVIAVLLLGWRGRPFGLAPLLAVAASVAWGAGLAALHGLDLVVAPFVGIVDALRFGGWFGLLLAIVATVANTRAFRLLLGAAVLVGGGELLLALAALSNPGTAGAWAGTVPTLGGISGAVMGIVLIEQVYRNAGPAGRWSLKYLCIGLGVAFAYDLFLFADALLMRQPDAALWAARGYIAAMVAPLVAVSAARNPEWSLDVYVSRRFVLHTASLAAVGGYLVLMALVAWSIRAYGGAWGGPVQAIFLVGSVLLLAMLLFSGQMRAKARVFLSKHFYNYRYDYREEWLRFSRTMTADEENPRPLGERVIQAVAQVVESPGGALWQARDGELVPTGTWNAGEPPRISIPLDGDLARFLAETEWVLTVPEWQRAPERYRDILMPDCLQEVPRPWALVPLMHHDRLVGFVVITRPRTGEAEPNWEDCDLLKIIGRQAASYLAQEEAARALGRAQQFETFNRLSAFVLHDLKNIIGQLTMLARNANRHRDSPAFMADAVDTLDHCVGRMNQLMNQLRGGLQAGSAKTFDLGEAVREAVGAQGGEEPPPQAELPDTPIQVHADRGRLVAVLGNVIQNAQDATPASGRVRVRAGRNGEGAFVEVEDTGCGMSPDFIRDRLFQPFDTSKGSTGMGIGAFEAREFVRGLGGELSVESTPGEGTCFRFRLPAQALVEPGTKKMAAEATR
jgi:putative PEP-CTERM system histidine kinase